MPLRDILSGFFIVGSLTNLIYFAKGYSSIVSVLQIGVIGKERLYINENFGI